MSVCPSCLQQLFRSQTQGATPQQLQLLQQQQQQQQQQQYLAASQAQQQQQQQQNFPTAPYTVISGQEPYVGALIAGAPSVVPQYYGVGPWTVYPAGLLPQAPPQAAAPPPRRPLTPSSAAAAAAAAQDSANNLAQTVIILSKSSQLSCSRDQDLLYPAARTLVDCCARIIELPFDIFLLFQVQGQYQVIPAYYDQNGSIVMGGVRGLGSAATPMRLVSPAPVLVNRAPSQQQPGPQAPPPPSLYSQPTPTSHSNATPGECLGKNAPSQPDLLYPITLFPFIPPRLFLTVINSFRSFSHALPQNFVHTFRKVAPGRQHTLSPYFVSLLVFVYFYSAHTASIHSLPYVTKKAKKSRRIHSSFIIKDN